MCILCTVVRKLFFRFMDTLSYPWYHPNHFITLFLTRQSGLEWTSVTASGGKKLNKKSSFETNKQKN